MTDTLSILKEVQEEQGAHAEDRRLGHALREFNRVEAPRIPGSVPRCGIAQQVPTGRASGADRGKVSQAAHAVADWLSDYCEAMENDRLAVSRRRSMNGMSKERAASLAKNLTVNFNRKGRQTRELGALYAFFNAAVQGTTRMAQTLAGPAGRKIIAGGVMLGVMNTLPGLPRWAGRW